MPKHPNITLTPVTSRKLHGIGYDAASKTLAVRFHPTSKNAAEGKPGALYHYANVTPEQFDSFRFSDSVGSHFISTFQKNAADFPYTRIDESASSDEG